MRLGYVGLGAMGLPFAQHLRKAGHEVTVFNRSDRPYQMARAAGMQIADSLEHCVAESEMVFTCLPSLEAIEDVFASIDKAGLICVDNSTVPQDMALRLNASLKARGMAYVECPIFGSAKDAESAQTYLVISGDDAPVETALPVAASSARGITHVGGPGAASLVKILQNGLGHVQLVAIAEALVAAEKAGLDVARFVEVVSACGGMASTSLFRRKAPQMLELPEETGAKLGVAAKDAKEAARLFASLGVGKTLIASAADAYEDAISMGNADKDFASVIEARRAYWSR